MSNERYTLYNGDCLEEMNKIADNSVDMILCDLPYGTTQNKWDKVIPLNDYIEVDGKVYYENDYKLKLFLEGYSKKEVLSLWKKNKKVGLWTQYNRVLKDNGVIALTSHGAFTAELIESNRKNFKYKIVWEKSKSTNFLNAKKQPLRKHEDICIFYKKQPTYNPQMTEGKPYNKGVRKDQLTGSYGKFSPVEVKSDGLRYPTDIIYFKTAESEGPVYNATQKPVALCEYLIVTYTNKNAIILDNTMGSGTTGEASLNTGRYFIGIEKDIDSFNISKNRLEKVCNLKKIVEKF